MGKAPKLNLPSTPTLQTDQTAKQAIPQLYSLSNQAATGNFTGDLSGLSQAVNPNQGYLQSALS